MLNIHFGRLFCVFSLATAVNLGWVRLLNEQVDPDQCLSWAGIGASLGAVGAGSLAAGLSLLKRHLQASSYRISLLGLLVACGATNLPVVEATPLWIATISSAVAIASSILVAQVSTLTMELNRAGFANSRRGGSVGYAAAFTVVSYGPEWSTPLFIAVSTIFLLVTSFRLPGAVDQNGETAEPTSAPTTKHLSIAMVFFLFACLGISAKVFESFGPAALLGTSSGVIAVWTLIAFECILLQRTNSSGGYGWALLTLSAWTAAYGFLLLDGSFGQTLALALISFNCCGQTTLQQKLQQAAQRNCANLQILLSTATAIASTFASFFVLAWTQLTESRIWWLGLLLAGLSTAFGTLAAFAFAKLSNRKVR